MAGEPPTGPPSEEPEVPAPAARPGTTDEVTTAGGYSYTIVDDAAASPPSVSRSPQGAASPWPWVALALVPLLLIAAGAYLFLDGTLGGDGGDDERLHADVTSLINAFSQGGAASSSERYEGELPPGLPEGLPVYDGARVLSSIRQTTGDDASYLVVYDTGDAHADVAGFFEEALNADPWQIEGGQDSRDSTVQSFSRVDDPDVSGIVLSAASLDGDVTTIVVSVDVVAGAGDSEEAFTPEASRRLPEGFPDTLPTYPEARVIESAYSKQGGALSFLVSFLTEDDASDVVAFYRDELAAAGLSVEDGDPSQSELAAADALSFTDAEADLVGDVFVGDFPRDGSFTQIDLRVRQGE